jgi:O-acetyl-ADP-ribose deacetylase (regulator of RNase III)
MKIIEGNLLDFPEDIDFAYHNANCRACMGSGIALEVRKRFPEVFQSDKDYSIQVGPRRLGNYSFSKLKKAPDKRVYNLYGQDLGGEVPFRIKSYMSALLKSLKHIRNECSVNKTKLPILGFPWLVGAGLGGGYFPYIKDVTEWMLDQNGFEGVWVKFNE